MEFAKNLDIILIFFRPEWGILPPDGFPNANTNIRAGNAIKCYKLSGEFYFI